MVNTPNTFKKQKRNIYISIYELEIGEKKEEKSTSNILPFLLLYIGHNHFKEKL
jgi:hypothetical protein